MDIAISDTVLDLWADHIHKYHKYSALMYVAVKPDKTGSDVQVCVPSLPAPISIIPEACIDRELHTTAAIHRLRLAKPLQLSFMTTRW